MRNISKKIMTGIGSIGKGTLHLAKNSNNKKNKKKTQLTEVPPMP